MIPLDTMVTAVSCIISACGRGNSTLDPFTAYNSISQICELKAENAIVQMKLDITSLESSLTRLLSSTNELNKLRKNAAPKRPKRSIPNSQLDEYADNSSLPEDCVGQTSGFAQISVNDKAQPFEVMCENNEKHGANWMVIADYHKGSMNFEYNAEEYTTGFKDVMGNYFIGAEKLYAITNSKLQELLILLIDDTGTERQYAHYTAFGIRGADKRYALNLLGVHSGNAVDNLSSFVGRSIDFVHGAYTGHMKVLVRPREVE